MTMSDTPHIKRFEEYPSVSFKNENGHYEEPDIHSVYAMLNDLAEHIERLEQDYQVLEKQIISALSLSTTARDGINTLRLFRDKGKHSDAATITPKET